MVDHCFRRKFIFEKKQKGSKNLQNGDVENFRVEKAQDNDHRKIYFDG